MGDNDGAGRHRDRKLLTVLKSKDRREMKTALDRWRRAVLGHAAKLRVTLEHEKRAAFVRVACHGAGGGGDGDQPDARPQPPLVLSSFPLGSAPFHQQQQQRQQRQQRQQQVRQENHEERHKQQRVAVQAAPATESED